MSKDLVKTGGQEVVEIRQTNAVDYKMTNKELVNALIEKSKNTKDLQEGLQSSDSIAYFSIDEKVKVGESFDAVYVARTLEYRSAEVDAKTGEVLQPEKMLPTVIFVVDGELYKSSSYMIVSHLGQQESGYAVRIKLINAAKKTKNGNKMFQLEFKPLFDAIN